MKRFTKYFFEGLLFLVPVVATVYVLLFVFRKIDGLFRFETPGIGFLVTIVLITIFGFIASNFLTRGAVRIIDRIMCRLPLVKMIYTSIKDLIGAFVGDKKGFSRPVLVKVSAESSVQASAARWRSICPSRTTLRAILSSFPGSR